MMPAVGLLAALPLLLAGELSTQLLDTTTGGGGELSILDFGGKPDGETNNQPAIVKAMAVCEKSGGCTLRFPRGNATDQPKGPAPYHPWGAPPVAVYRTAAINLTSHLRLVLDEGVQLRGTEDFAANCGGTNRSTCDDLDSPWPVLPNAVYPSRQNSAGDDAGPVKQAFIRGYNLTDITIDGGGEVHGGGGWWWYVSVVCGVAGRAQRISLAWARCGCTHRCVRMAASTVDPAKHETTGAHAPRWCESMVKAGLIPDLARVQAPHMIHLIGCKNVLISNITISNSPEWTIHLQYSDNVTLSHVNVFNPNNVSIEAPNADGIDVDSSSNVHVRDSIFDVGDDALCCKSGSDFDGRAVGIPSRNVLFERIEVRNGHGLTLGSEASGGMINITYRDIFINSMGGPQAPGKRKRPGAVGSIHFKSGRGRGGHWENITYENIYGNGASGAPRPAHLVSLIWFPISDLLSVMRICFSFVCLSLD